MIGTYMLFLGLGHILGDFYFQNDLIAENKVKSFKWVIYHCLITGLVAYLVLALAFGFGESVKWALLLSGCHLLIDGCKYAYSKNRRTILKKLMEFNAKLTADKSRTSTNAVRENGLVFIVDQLLHLVSLVVVAMLMQNAAVKYDLAGWLKNLFDQFNVDHLLAIRYILAVLLIYRPINFLIASILGDFAVKATNSSKPADAVQKIDVYAVKGNSENKELKNVVEIKQQQKQSQQEEDNKAGRVIGFIERMIMLYFLLIEQYSAVGLVLTAKSIARFEKISKDQGFAERYLIGTLLSVACLILVKLVVLS